MWSIKRASISILALLFVLSASAAFATTATMTPAPGAVPISRQDSSLDPGWLPKTGLSQANVYLVKNETDLIAAIAASTPIIQLTANVTLTANRTIPVGEILYPNGFSIARAGFTLTINSYFPYPGAYGVFTGSGSTVFGANALAATADPAWFPTGAVEANSAAANVIVVLTANSATPSVAALAGIRGTYQTNNSTATTITNFTGGVVGQQFTLVANDTYTSIQLGAQITGLQGSSGTIALSQGDMVQVSYGGVSATYCTANGAPAACCTALGVGAGCNGTNWHVVLVGAPNSNSFYRNRFINGEMRIDQRNRGAAQTITTNGSAPLYTVDRWFANVPAGSGTITGQQAVGSGQWKNIYQLTGGAANTAFVFGQRIESINIADQAGSTVTLSGYVMSSILTSLTWTAYYPASLDTWGIYNSGTQIATGTWTINNTLAKYTASISLPSGAANGVAILFSGTNFTSGTLSITGAQLEPGLAASAFERRPDDVEFLRCQRYLPGQSFTKELGLAGGPGTALTATTLQVPFLFPTQSRGSPTGIITSTVTDWSVWEPYGEVTETASVITLDVMRSPFGAMVDVTCTTGLTAGRMVYLCSSVSYDYILFTGCEL